MQASVSDLLEREVDLVLKETEVQAASVSRVYSLAALLEYPPMAHIEASMGLLHRHCSKLRAAASSSSDSQDAYLDILQVISGAYYGQNEAMRAEFREHGVHV